LPIAADRRNCETYAVAIRVSERTFVAVNQNVTDCRVGILCRCWQPVVQGKVKKMFKLFENVSPVNHATRRELGGCER
jgi:hypothetical protein